MSADTVNVTVSKDLIAPIVEAKIKAAMVEALGGSEALVEGIVDSMLREKVGRDGKKSQYSSENKYDWLDVILGNTIRDACQEAMKEWVADNQSLIKSSLRAQMEKKSTRDAMAKGLLEGVVNATKNHFAFHVKFGFESDDNAKSGEFPF